MNETTLSKKEEFQFDEEVTKFRSHEKSLLDKVKGKTREIALLFSILSIASGCATEGEAKPEFPSDEAIPVQKEELPEQKVSSSDEQKETILSFDELEKAFSQLNINDTEAVNALMKQYETSRDSVLESASTTEKHEFLHHLSFMKYQYVQQEKMMGDMYVAVSADQKQDIDSSIKTIESALDDANEAIQFLNSEDVNEVDKLGAAVSEQLIKYEEKLIQNLQKYQRNN